MIIDRNSQGYKELIGQIEEIIKYWPVIDIDDHDIAKKLGISARFTQQLLRSMGYIRYSDLHV